MAVLVVCAIAIVTWGVTDGEHGPVELKRRFHQSFRAPRTPPKVSRQAEMISCFSASHACCRRRSGLYSAGFCSVSKTPETRTEGVSTSCFLASGGDLGHGRRQ